MVIRSSQVKRTWLQVHSGNKFVDVENESKQETHFVLFRSISDQFIEIV